MIVYFFSKKLYLPCFPAENTEVLVSAIYALLFMLCDEG